MGVTTPSSVIQKSFMPYTSYWPSHSGVTPSGIFSPIFIQAEARILPSRQATAFSPLI